jgi:hypothetical protein
MDQATKMTDLFTLVLRFSNFRSTLHFNRQVQNTDTGATSQEIKNQCILTWGTRWRSG